MSLRTGLLLAGALSQLFLICLAAPLDDEEGEHAVDLEPEHWVLSVPLGHERAKRLAEEHSLNFLGEVLPESNLYHYSIKDSSRRKRSLDSNLHAGLISHPHIEEVHPQKTLTRVKRRPMEDWEEDQIEERISRQADESTDAPEVEGSGEDENKVCLIYTKESESKESRRCIFPFSFKGKTYADCTTDESTNEAEWCATEVDQEGQVVHLQWGDCDRENKKCFAPESVPKLETPVKKAPGISNEKTGKEVCFIFTQKTDVKEPKKCIFPFTFKGKTYNDCTTDESSNEAEWCATEIDDAGEAVNEQWGDCDRSNRKCFVVGDAPHQNPPLREAAVAHSSAAPGKEVCFIHTYETEKKESKRCIFPFGYKGKSYVDCTADHSSNGAEWCATEVNKDGQAVNGQWGDCDRSNRKCFVLGADHNQIISAPSERKNPRPPSPPSQQAQFDPRQQLRGSRGPPGFPDTRGYFPFGGFPSSGIPNSEYFQQGNFPPANFPQGNFPQGNFPQGNFPPNNFQRQQQGPGFPGPPGFGGQFPGLPELSGAGKKKQFPPEVIDESLLNITNQLNHHFNDKAWPYMWFLNRGGKGSHGLDMNVDEAWSEGVTGKGVVVSILDDGIEWNHPDLKDNYDTQASTDLNDNDNDPFPRYDMFNSNKHGTRCAGTVAAVANNSICAVGIAYNSKVGGIRILDGNIVDVLEAKALSFNRNHIDIYSASWGPDDNGKTIDGPGPLAAMALKDGVEKGRNGKGSIFVWASGNGGKYKDNCNCDGYTTSIYTLSVSSVSEQGSPPWYSEVCSSSLATTFSSGSKNKDTTERKVITTDLHGECTELHTGTSASSPMAAGIVALALEKNPELNWRDLQHLVIRTARPRGLLQAIDWAPNGVGLQFSHSYGFGLMDAGKLVKLAKIWKTVPEQINCTTILHTPPAKIAKIESQNEEVYTIDANECADVKFLEHVQLLIDLSSSSRRGDLRIHILSPSGTQSILLTERPHDNIRTGLSSFAKWPMMSVHFWGEDVASNGSTWKLLVQNTGDRSATLNSWQLNFFGTAENPQPGLPITPPVTEKPIIPLPVVTTESPKEDPVEDDQEELPRKPYIIKPESRTDSEPLSAEGVTTPVEDVATPVDGVALPVEGVATPVEGVATPVEGVATPVEGVATPVEGVATPVEAVAKPADEPEKDTNKETTQAPEVKTPKEEIDESKIAEATSTSSQKTEGEGQEENTDKPDVGKRADEDYLTAEEADAFASLQQIHTF